jgi:hypothetical protein
MLIVSPGETAEPVEMSVVSVAFGIAENVFCEVGE